jgi:SEC-C motif
MTQEKSTLGRNDLCWCRSGKKYKKCHLNRNLQKKNNPWSAVESNKKEFHKKKCCAENGAFGPCEGKIVKAHTVSRGSNLTKIAKKSKVMSYNTNISKINKNGGQLIASEIGIGVASTFYGFCSQHDRTLFSCIENEDFIGRPDQCIAIAYRSLSRELYGKDAASHLRETLRDADKGDTITEQVTFQSILDLNHEGNEAARAELKKTHDILTNALANGCVNTLQSMIIKFDNELPFMFAGAWSPFTDLHGKKLQSGYANQLLEQIFISSFASLRSSYICISWVNIENAPGSIIAKQICELPGNKQAEIILQYAVKHIENVFYAPSWFEDLSFLQRRQLDKLAASGIDILGSVPDDDIHFGLGFLLPTTTQVFHSTDVPSTEKREMNE